MHATCRATLIFLTLMTLILFGEVYIELNSSVCNVLQQPVTSFLLRPNTVCSGHSNGNYLPANMLGNKNHEDFQMIITTSGPYNKLTNDNSANTI
jgi:hypothetical protein